MAALSSHASNNSQQSGMKRSPSSDPPRANKRPSSREVQLQVTTTSVGQTAPRLIHVIKTADRADRVDNERNPFIHPPRGFDEQFDAKVQQHLSPPCKHQWTTQRSQSVLPESGVDVTAETYRLTCFCQLCHWHLDLQIQHTQQPCPKPDYPLHHFAQFVRDGTEWYQARCSGCAAAIRIDYRRPRLEEEHIFAMTNEDRLRKRLARARKNDPERGHDKPAAPIDVLDAMGTYLRDALSAEEERKIPKLNRRFLTSFGDDCKDFLTDLGFEDVGDFYALPRPGPADPWAWGLRKKLEDTQEELWALMRSLKQNDASINLDSRKGYNPTMEPFGEDIQLLFSTFEYDKSKTVRRMPVLSLEESTWYAGLGALGDMSDDLIAFAYDRQIAVDPTNMPYYFDCLTNIAKKRNSETLEMKMALLASEGCYGRGEVMEAYKYFVPDVRQPVDLTDTYLRGLFESRMGSVSKAGGQEAREMLRIIGTARGSKALLDAASDEITDHHSALRFLDASYNENAPWGDDYVIALAGAKKAETDDHSHQEKVEKAVRLIAEHRNSAVLHAFLATGEAAMTSDDDDIAAAYRFFEISERSTVPDLVVLQYQVAIINEDSTASADRKEKANKYFELLKNLDNNPTPSKMPANYEMPVGLVNNRNYCYLHALLQFFNSIRPFRETVVDFEKFAQAIETADETELGRLAGSDITKLHVEDGHQLVPHLTKLFQRLETAPGPEITAPEAIAAEALRQPPSAPQPSMPPPEPAQGNKKRDDDDDTATVTVKADSPQVGQANSPDSEMSDVTLIGDTVMTPDSEADDLKKESDTDSLKVEGGPGSDSGVSVGDKPEPPSRDPPKVPPRPKPFDNDLEDQYRQQDAHEVSSKIIQRTIAAIKPTSIDEDGERHDYIRNLFYAITQSVATTDSDVKKEFKPEFATNFFIHMNNKPKDVQEGLDIALGKVSTANADQPETKFYQVIKQAPPILQVYIHHNIFATKKGENVFERKRVAHHMIFNEEIYLDRYMEHNQQAILPIRQQAFELRDELAKLEAARRSLIVEDVKVHDENANGPKDDEIDSADALDVIAGLLEAEIKDQLVDTNGTLELSKQLRHQAEEDGKKVKEIEEWIPQKRADLDALPLNSIDSDSLKYRIFAAFMYNGSGNAGHWKIYIRDFKNNQWRCYNDSRVTNVSEDEVFMKRPLNDFHAPLVAYVRDDRKDELVDPLHRNRPEPGPGADEDFVMDDPDAPDSPGNSDKADSLFDAPDHTLLAMDRAESPSGFQDYDQQLGNFFQYHPSPALKGFFQLLGTINSLWRRLVYSSAVFARRHLGHFSSSMLRYRDCERTSQIPCEEATSSAKNSWHQFYITHARQPLLGGFVDEEDECEEHQPDLNFSSNRINESGEDQPNPQTSDSGGEDGRKGQSDTRSSSEPDSGSSYYKKFDNEEDRLDSKDFEEDEHPSAGDENIGGILDPVPARAKHRQKFNYGCPHCRIRRLRVSPCAERLRHKAPSVGLTPRLWCIHVELSRGVRNVFKTYDLNS